MPFRVVDSGAILIPAKYCLAIVFRNTLTLRTNTVLLIRGYSEVIMKSKWIIVVCFICVTSACYDFSLKSPDSGVGDGSTTVSDAFVGITDSVGNPSTEGISFAGGGANIATGSGGDSAISAAGTAGGGASGEPGRAQADAGPSNATECNADSCPNGCCEGTTCVEFSMQSGTQCGAAGTACQSCPTGQSCGSTGACGCDPISCPDGCCANSECVPTDSQTNTLCGAKGAAVNH
jgi:hypothetical protein